LLKQQPAAGGAVLRCQQANRQALHFQVIILTQVDTDTPPHADQLAQASVKK
jgi:hypothetical protein